MYQGIRKVGQAFITGNVSSAFFNIFQGRCTLAAICFSVVGVYGWFNGKDLSTFTVFVGAIQSLLLLHSWKEDVAEQRQIRDSRMSNAQAPSAGDSPAASQQ